MVLTTANVRDNLSLKHSSVCVIAKQELFLSYRDILKVVLITYVFKSQSLFHKREKMWSGKSHLNIEISSSDESYFS